MPSNFNQLFRAIPCTRGGSGLEILPCTTICQVLVISLSQILHSLDPIQVVFRGVPSNMKTKALIMMVKVFVAKACSTRVDLS